MIINQTCCCGAAVSIKDDSAVDAMRQLNSWFENHECRNPNEIERLRAEVSSRKKRNETYEARIEGLCDRIEELSEKYVLIQIMHKADMKRIEELAKEIKRLRAGWNECADDLDKEQHRTGELNTKRVVLEQRIEELEADHIPLNSKLSVGCVLEMGQLPRDFLLAVNGEPTDQAIDCRALLGPYERRIEELEKLDPDALTKATNALFQVLREDGYHIFTAAKIDAAWELVEWHRTRGAVMSARDMERALEKFGIERDGDGWKIGGSDD